MFKNHDLILFDLDGTISDPLKGIGRSINYALTHFGYEPLKLSELAKYVGPPLDETFKKITGNEAESQNFVAKYRERYGDIGYSENILYPGIAEVLLDLHKANIPMALCTLKRQDFAEQILEMFGIIHYFQFISGGEIGVSKSQQIEFLLLHGQVSKTTVMIGDRAVDMIAAHKNGLDAGGVLWGYGSQTELLQESPLYLFSAPSELIQLAHQG
ncbi:MAG: HAD hydrolase-like protein [Thermosynechococcaceae cyanobacterium MS004]|nr:HAD hydrolase-like protein [Thermosynechococcaceae cyanobacterium MS004]